MKATMKLSEAILLGSVGSPQGFGPMAIYQGSTGLCALGAALKACGELEESSMRKRGAYTNVRELWPWTESAVPPPQGTSLHRMAASDMVWLLNDREQWTRPQIAAWVAELEKTYDPDPVPVPEQEPVTETIHQ